MIDINAFFKISYGLYIVSSGNQHKGNGFISNAVFQVTAQPAQFAVCCNKDNYSAKLISEAKAFSISVLKQEASSDLIGLFGYQSGKEVNKMEKVKAIYGTTGVPMVTDDALALFECKLVQTFEVETHLIFIGEIIQTKVLLDGEPLTYAYYRNVKKGMAPKNAPTYIDKSKLTENRTTEQSTEVYKCPICGYEHEIAKGDLGNEIEPGTQWQEIPDTYSCPMCGAAKEDFYKL